MSRQDFFIALCGRMGWAPTPWRLAVFDYWSEQEGMPYERTFNPLATTRLSPGITLKTEDIGYGPGNWNSVPVRMYATLADGVEATAQTLELDYYVNIRRSFRDQVGYPEVIGPRDFTSWVGSDAYGSRVLQFMRTTPASRDMAVAPGALEARVAALEAVFGGPASVAAWNKRDNDLLLGYGNLQGTVQDLANTVLVLAKQPDGDGRVRADLIAGLDQLLARLKEGQR